MNERVTAKDIISEHRPRYDYFAQQLESAIQDAFAACLDKIGYSGVVIELRTQLDIRMERLRQLEERDIMLRGFLQHANEQIASQKRKGAKLRKQLSASKEKTEWWKQKALKAESGKATS
jgi:uncharacterized coiled-coil protein SlyX